MKEKIFNLILAISLLGLGIIFLGDIFNIWNISKFFNGWWTIFILIPSLMGIIFKSSKLVYTYIFSTCLVILFTKLNIIKMNNLFSILISILIFLFVIYIIYYSFKKDNKKLSKKQASLYTGICGSIDEKFSSIEFKGCEVLSVCGSVELDLTKTKIIKNSNINITCVLGSVTILVPNNVEVLINGKSILGSTSNHKVTSKKTISTLNIKSTCVLGGVEIK